MEVCDVSRVGLYQCRHLSHGVLCVCLSVRVRHCTCCLLFTGAVFVTADKLFIASVHSRHLTSCWSFEVIHRVFWELIMFSQGHVHIVWETEAL